MTSLVCWTGVDSRTPASIYLASDSRISWKSGESWDHGRKVFACKNSPDLLGYVGQVVFPSQALSQVQDLIEAGLLFKPDAYPEEKRDAVFDVLKSNFETYPVERNRPFTVVHSTRRSEGMYSTFCVFTLCWDPCCGWKEEILTVPAASGIVRAWGSGRAAVERWHKYWMNSRQGGRTSRSIFSAFCDALASGEDQSTGGHPQLVGLWRRGGGKSFGVIYRRARYFLGIPLSDQSLLSNVEWRNVLFERCDGQTMDRFEGAQRHAHPRGLGMAYEASVSRAQPGTEADCGSGA